MKIQLSHSYGDIISLENLFLAWQEFICGKKSKPDVRAFKRYLIDNIVTLHWELSNQSYCHGGYKSFFINDPKRRHIHKASVRDRLLHHAVYRVLYPFFECIFIADSYSCRQGKGTHRAINRFRSMHYQVSRNNTRTCWVLKCDIRKFFASIDHRILIAILYFYIPDRKIIWLLSNVIGSFWSISSVARGMPLGNLTSQLFANVYMNQLDQWVKHKLKARHYIRYADDFVFMSHNRAWLEMMI
jgi:retron-type reverse transcriptase